MDGVLTTSRYWIVIETAMELKTMMKLEINFNFFFISINNNSIRKLKRITFV